MRVFIALTFEEDLKSYLQEKQDELRSFCDKGNFTERGNFHLTIRFIGEVDQDQIENIKKTMDETAKVCENFFLNLENLGSFERQKEYIPWIGLGGDLSKLNNLYNQLQLQLHRVGFAIENRPLKPHITLGRRVQLKKPFDQIEGKIFLEKRSILIDSMVLMKSIRVNGKLTYIPVYKKKLSNKA